MSNIGVVVLAQDSPLGDYVIQTCLLAMSLKKTNPELPISIVTNNNVPEEYKSLFDNIIPIPFSDNALDVSWKIENRWKIYHATPYEETIVMDSDMVVLQDISSWISVWKNYDLFFTSSVYTYRGDKVTSDYYRKAFTSNHLPNLYSGLYYFKKCDFSHVFFKWVELITYNWEKFYSSYVSEHYPGRYSFDITVSLVSKILDCDTEITNAIAKFPSFTHMKPHVQGWESVLADWQDCVGVYVDEQCNIKLGNYQQTGILHYTNNDFVHKHKVLEKYRNYLNV